MIPELSVNDQNIGRAVADLASVRRFYFDTARPSSPAAMPAPEAFAGSDQILFGADFPSAPADVAMTATR